MIKHLSEKQKELKQQIESTSCVKTIQNLKTKRNRILTTIHNELLPELQQRIEDTILNLEKNPDDSRKMFTVVKHLQRTKPKLQFLIKNDKGMLTSDQKQQANIINHFKKPFLKDVQKYPPIPPRQMQSPFTAIEVTKTLHCMKNKKSLGKDQVHVELIKYGPIQVHQLTADICNKVVTFGTYPAELNEGLLTALQKSKMKIGELNNLRPKILLSTLRKILAIIMTSRIKDRIEKEIPPTQAAYRSGRSTNEHVFALKLVVERKINIKGRNTLSNTLRYE